VKATSPRKERGEAKKRCNEFPRLYKYVVSDYGDPAIFRGADFHRRKNLRRLSTLKIRVKRRLSIWWHRPAVSF
jgi:hypothetical protein